MNAPVQRIGNLAPSMSFESAGRTMVDAAPVVLWSKAVDPVVVVHRILSSLAARRVQEEFVRADGGGGAFPIAASDTLAPGAGEDSLDLYESAFVLTADLDGDGADELVLLRARGGVEAYRADRALHRSPGLGERRGVVGYRPRSAFRARVGSRDVLLLVYARNRFGNVDEAELARLGFSQRSIVVRVDERGATPVPIEADGFHPERVLAVGALNRPGSAALDELVVLSLLPGAKEPVLSRHWPDGKLIAPPRAFYVPLAATEGVAFEAIPQSPRTLLHAGSSVYFVTPDKPVNWIRAVDLAAYPDSAQGVELLGVANAQAAPKAIVRIGPALYAIDEEGTAHVTRPGAGWGPSRSREPFHRIAAPSQEHRLVGVFRDASSDALLVVHTRSAAPRVLTDDELEAAAKRFLPPGELADRARDLEPSLDGWDGNRDEFIAEERRATGADAPRTVEEWRARFPRSYERWTNLARASRRAWLEVKLVTDPESSGRNQYVDRQGYLAWRREIIRAGETHLALVRRGAVVAELRVPGAHPLAAESTMRRPRVEFRAAGDRIAAVFAIDVGEPGTADAGYYLVRGP
jgi:hypothetical protein